MRTTSVTSTRSKVKIKVTDVCKLRKLHFLCLSPPPFRRGSQNWWLIMIVWDLLYSVSEPDFWISFSVSCHANSNFAECRSYRTFKRPYFHIAGRYNHMVRYAVLCMLMWPWPNPKPRSRSQSDDRQSMCASASESTSPKWGSTWEMVSWVLIAGWCLLCSCAGAELVCSGCVASCQTETWRSRCRLQQANDSLWAGQHCLQQFTLNTLSEIVACTAAGETETLRTPRGLRGDGYGAYEWSMVLGIELHGETAGPVRASCDEHTVTSCCVKIASPRVHIVYWPSVMRPNYAQWPTAMQPV